ncbi:lipoyl(octanoyl) transferase LipB [bacterium]|nr:lipoyl(octanoyl) transferase LipB [candidate division CSSED10-310 bacterium]
MIEAYWFGRQPIARMFELQDEFFNEQRRRSRSGGEPLGVLLLAEHDPVYSVKRITTDFIPDCINAPPELLATWAERRIIEIGGIPVPVIEAHPRGGRITYHGPGQLVVYTIIDMVRIFPRDTRPYPTELAEAVLTRALDKLGISTVPHCDAADCATVHTAARGAWVEQDGERRKIGSCGFYLDLATGVTSHGFALNVQPDLQFFDAISPCCIAGARATSLAAISGRTWDMGDMAGRLVDACMEELHTPIRRFF